MQTCRTNAGFMQPSQSPASTKYACAFPLIDAITLVVSAMRTRCTCTVNVAKKGHECEHWKQAAVYSERYANPQHKPSLSKLS
jgi:hypothetical protein